MSTEENTTKIIKTQRGELVFLATFAVFIVGILGAYYNLVTNVAVIRNDMKNQTALIQSHMKQYEDHVALNDKDHDLLVALCTITKDCK